MNRILINILIFLSCLLLFSCAGNVSNESSTRSKIAVLPLSSVNTDPAYQYVGKGLTHEVITKMYYLKGIVVRSYGSVKDLQLSGLEQDVIAHQLDIDYLLKGNYTTGNDSLILDLELIHLPVENTIWTKHCEVSMASLFTLPEKVTREIVPEMGIKTDRDGIKKLTLDTSLDPNAYQLYLKAVAADPKTPEDWMDCIKLLERSIELDSLYAPSWTGFGHAYMEYSGLVGGRKGLYTQAEHSLVKALEVNSDLPQAIEYLGLLYAKIGKPEKAIDLLSEGAGKYPNYPGFYSGLGYVNRYAGQMDESILAYRRSQALDSGLNNLVRCQMQILKSQIYKGDYSTAKQSFGSVCANLRTLGEKPDEKQLFYAGVIHLYMKDTVEAIALFDSAYAVNPESVWTTFGQAYKALLENNREKLLETAEELESRDIVDGERRYRMVHFYTLGEKKNEALKHLKISVEGGFFNYPYISSDPLTVNLREKVEFRDIAELANRRYKAFKR